MKKKDAQLDMAEIAMRTVFGRCLAFFLAAGINEERLRARFDESMEWAKARKIRAKIYKAGSINIPFEICQKWLRDPKYLNKAGNPRSLPLRGTRSIQSLMKDLGLTARVSDTAAKLIRIGSVQRTRDKKYLIIQKGFYAKRKGRVAFEPYARFLIQAVTTATLPIDSKESDKHSYWLSSTRDNLTDEQMAKFVEFIKRKGLSQLTELDDWFAAMGASDEPIVDGAIPSNTLGVGMFTFVTEPNSI